MGLLDDYSGRIGSPRPKWRHQIVMDSLYYNMRQELKEQGLNILTESTVTDDWDDLAPDLVIFDENFNPLSIIEITTKKECRKIKIKCMELIERFPDAEYFVYDYESNKLFKYDLQGGTWFSSDQYTLCSNYLQNPILDYLDE